MQKRVYEKFIHKLQEIAKRKRLHLVHLGDVGKKLEYPLYAIVIPGNNVSKRTICISAGIHGDELSGPWGILDFLAKIKPQKEYTLIILPVVNPSGFDKGKYKNYLNKNLNRYFCKKNLSKECKIIYDFITKYNIAFFVALHEDDVKKGTYLYGYTNKETKKEIYREILSKMSHRLPICTDKKIYTNKGINGIVENPISDGSFEERMQKDGIKYSACIEVPDCFVLPKGKDFVVYTIKEVINICKEYKIV